MAQPQDTTELSLRFMDTRPCFFSIFTKENNFFDLLFPSQAEETLPKWGLLLKGDNYSP